MSKTLQTGLGWEYDRLFGNYDELAHPEVIHQPKFKDLVRNAIASKQKLAWDDVHRVFPNVFWDE